LPVEKGLMVITVEKNSPAFQSGLLKGDIIISFNGKTISGIDDLHKMLSEDNLGMKSRLKIIRYTDILEFNITPVEKLS
jgi:S1-C subfamily serine protease